MSVSASPVTCRSCGAEIEVSALLCPKCGQPNVSTAFAAPGYAAPYEPEPTEQQHIPTAPISENKPAEVAATEREEPAEQAIEATAEPVVSPAPTPFDARTATIEVPELLRPLGTPSPAPAEYYRDPLLVPPADHLRSGVPNGRSPGLRRVSAPETEYHCPECAAPVAPGAHLCEGCGHPFDSRGSVESTIRGIGETVPWFLKYCPFYILLVIGFVSAVTFFVVAGVRRLTQHPQRAGRRQLRR